jgi:adapter protein MecA 1/2
MRVERIGQDKIRFFLTFDDLSERGIEKKDMWGDIPKIHDLFNDMMEKAYDELGFEVTGPVAVEVFALPAQGMIVVVTRGKSMNDEQFDDDDPDIYEMEVTLEETDCIIYGFKQFEDVISASKVLASMTDEGQLYYYEQHYYLKFDDDLFSENEIERLVSVLSEYGEPSAITSYMLSEYGKVIMDKKAVGQVTQFFR